MREFRTYGSVRGAHGNGRPYRNQTVLVSEAEPEGGRGSHPELGPCPALRRDGDGRHDPGTEDHPSEGRVVGVGQTARQ
jgi:hypothetical protein